MLKDTVQGGSVPWRWLYPIGGALLGLLTLGGFVALRGLHQPDAVTLPWMLREVATQPLAYAYLMLWTTVTLAILGRLIGRREDGLLQQSLTDPSTGLANRRALQSELLDALRAHQRRGTPVSLLILDVDRLKSINDVLGHSAGDAALRAVAQAVRAACRQSDLAARWGGDEFVVVARGTSAAGGLELAERIRATLRRLLHEDDYAALPLVTLSVGVADLEHASAPRPEALFYAADRALYNAKTSGRDRVAIAGAADGTRHTAMTAPNLPRAGVLAHAAALTASIAPASAQSASAGGSAAIPAATPAAANAASTRPLDARPAGAEKEQAHAPRPRPSVVAA
ncbi:MAG TPA: GGDEF domain-containing protein [Myxococcota bacterium]|jgi:diguanylate cyclase (GGDEF)-like protein|nr:GGDEF domain-containing protein [Myxococcota bacterium]